MPAPHARVNDLRTHTSINGVPFGCTENELFDYIGDPDARLTASTGELELHVGATIYRCHFGRFVECTFPDAGRTRIDGVPVLNVFEWLAACDDVINRAGFRISLAHGLAYDRRDPAHGSITVFEKHRWDDVVNLR